MPIWFYFVLAVFATICTGTYAILTRGRGNKLVSIGITVAAVLVGYLWAYNHVNYFIPPTTGFLHFTPTSGTSNVETVVERWLYGTTLPTLPGTVTASTLPTGGYEIDWKVKGHDIKVDLSRHYHTMEGVNADGNAFLVVLHSGEYN